LRLFIDDDVEPCRRARAFVDEAARKEPCLVNSVVLAEFAWVLLKALKRPKGEVIEYLEGLLEAADLEIERRPAARGALASYRSGKADFSDYLLAHLNVALGCTSTATFDEEALRFSIFSPVPKELP